MYSMSLITTLEGNRMNLQYSFEYVSNNEMLEKILLRALKKSEVSGFLSKDDKHLYLNVSAEEEAQTAFSNLLAKELPMSIFLRTTDAKVVETFEQEQYELQKNSAQERAFCPSCLEQVSQPHHEAYYDLFQSCEVCGFESEKRGFTLNEAGEQFIATEPKGFVTLIAKISEAILAGKRVAIESLGSKRVYGLCNEANIKDVQFDVLVNDVASIAKSFVVQERELFALSSIEKPFINLRFNLLFKEKELTSQKFARVKLADDFLLFFLSQALLKEGISYIAMPHTTEAEVEVKLLGDKAYAKELCVEVLENNQKLILSGEHGIVPFTKAFHKEGVSKACELVAQADTKLLQLHKGEEELVTSPSFSLKEENKNSDVVYEAAHGAYLSVLFEQDLFEQKTAGLYVSKSFSDKVMIHSPKFGLVDYVCIDYNLDAKNIFDAIANMDETGKSLVENFLTRFPEAQERLNKSTLKLEKANFYNLWALLAVVLGYYEGSSVDEAAKLVIANANEYNGKKGPRIDYKLEKRDERIVLEPLWAIRTAMSFRLAGLDEATLCFGVLESLAEYLVGSVEEIHQDHQIDGVCVAGSLLDTKVFTKALHEGLAKNTRVYFNDALPVDYTNLAVGGLCTALL